MMKNDEYYLMDERDAPYRPNEGKKYMDTLEDDIRNARLSLKYGFTFQEGTYYDKIVKTYLSEEGSAEVRVCVQNLI